MHGTEYISTHLVQYLGVVAWSYTTAVETPQPLKGVYILYNFISYLISDSAAPVIVSSLIC